MQLRRRGALRVGRCAGRGAMGGAAHLRALLTREGSLFRIATSLSRLSHVDLVQRGAIFVAVELWILGLLGSAAAHAGRARAGDEQAGFL